MVQTQALRADGSEPVPAGTTGASRPGPGEGSPTRTNDADPDPGSGRNEVSISNEARERASRARDTREVSPPPEPVSGPSVLAVRVGPAPVTPASEHSVEQVEVGGGAIPTVAPVLNTPSAPQGASAAESVPSPAPGADHAPRNSEARAQVELLGVPDPSAPRLPNRPIGPPSDAPAASLPSRPLMGSGASVAGSAEAPEPQIGFSAVQTDRIERSEAERPVSTADVERAATFASAAAAPKDAEPDLRPELLGAPDEPVGSAIARSELTQAGVVEAQRADDPIARYLAQNPAVEAGPEPRVREQLGVRSQPISYYT